MERERKREREISRDNLLIYLFIYLFGAHRNPSLRIFLLKVEKRKGCLVPSAQRETRFSIFRRIYREA